MLVERSDADLFPYPPVHPNTGDIAVRWYFQDVNRLPVHVHRYDLPPGAVEGSHRHDTRDEPLDELYIVLAGTATVTIDGQTTTLGPGDAALAQAGTEHEVANTGERPLRVLNIWGHPAPHRQPPVPEP